MPQGFILWPVLFSLYMLPLGSIIARHNIAFHCYTDDLQIYLPMRPKYADAAGSLTDCIHDIKLWLEQNFLHLNEEKTEYILFWESVTFYFNALTSKLSLASHKVWLLIVAWNLINKLTAWLKLFFFRYVFWPRSNHFWIALTLRKLFMLLSVQD